MTLNRILSWEGCNNVRDLGGLNASNGYKTRWGAVVRSDHPSKLTAKGWTQLQEHGIRTIVALQTFGLTEDSTDTSPRPANLANVRVDIEDFTDADFVKKWADTGLWSTPLYYPDALNRWTEPHVAAMRGIAQAQPGGVLIHCGRGVDRTGIISILLLSLVGVAPEDILADYQLSIDPEREELLAREGKSTREVILDTINHLNAEKYLISGGLSQTELDAIRTRFVENV
jgi:protein-tyrosine phosphatase